MEKKPLLTIGMIFKNEIRCLERCLEALRPLRDAIPCELVMADTGSGDGSREVAGRYADILFDFPWIDDFAAARNAVMDRASGEWYMTVDADEYLDPDISELTEFLRGGDRRCTGATLVVRNYYNYKMEGVHTDFAALRLLRMSTGMRYDGAIHESWKPKPGQDTTLQIMPLGKTLLHHDGYVGLGEEGGRAKRQRNLRLIRRELEKAPRDLRRHLQYIESGRKEADIADWVRRAMELVEGKVSGWEIYGPPIFRLAVSVAINDKLPETEEWIQRALDRFPDSPYTRVDVAALAFGLNWNQKKDYAACVRWGEMYFAACADYDRDSEKLSTRAGGPVSKASPADRESMRNYLAGAYVKENLPEKALALLMDMRVDQMDAQKVGDLTDTVLSLHSHSLLDTAPLMRKLWEGVNDREAGRDTSMKRRIAFLSGCARVFSSEDQDSEADDIQRPAYTALLPLADVCAVGIGAAVLESGDPAEIAGLLGRVEWWNELPHAAVVHAVRAGVHFPPPGASLYLEELDELAARAVQDPEAASELLEKALEGAGTQDRSWARALALALVNACKWEDEEAGLRLARQFAKAEAAFLPLCYAPEALGAEELPLLPPMHRFGRHCVRAFDALDGGDAAGYVRCLRQGLKGCESAKPMVEFLLEHTPELQAPPPDPELLELAEKVRTMLAAFPADDPAVAALKASPVYQEVAHLIEV